MTSQKKYLVSERIYFIGERAISDPFNKLQLAFRKDVCVNTSTGAVKADTGAICRALLELKWFSA